MMDEMIKKYVKDMEGLLKELWLAQMTIAQKKIKEKAVIFIFGRIFRFLNFEDVMIGHEKAGDLDALAWTKDEREVIIEFESRSKNFNHDISKCDLIVCWEHDWKDCPIDVLELKYLWERAQEKFVK
jgi:hypothetical protein